MTRTIATRQIATSTIAGTDFPVNVTINRFSPKGRRPVWTVATICNGVGDEVRDFGTLSAARAEFDAR